MLDIIFTTILIWLMWWLTPWPIIFISFSEILKNEKSWLYNWLKYVFVSWITEFFIGLFLIITYSYLNIPTYIFHFLWILGSLMLIYISYNILKIKDIDYKEKNNTLKTKHIVYLMLFNWPMWVFWVTVCIFVSFKFWQYIIYWQYLFLVIFEFFMLLWSWILLLLFKFFRKLLINERFINKNFTILAILIFILAIKVLYWEIIYFIY